MRGSIYQTKPNLLAAQYRRREREINDEVSQRLQDYEWAIKKHGLETVVGHLESIIDPRFLAPTAGLAGIVGLFGEPLWGALAAGCTLLGRVSLKLASYLLAREDLARKVNPEVSYVYQVKSTLAKSLPK